MIVDGFTVDAPLHADVAIVGAGPAGIVTALELTRSGIDVLLVESGRDRYSREIQQLGDAAEFDPQRHAAMSVATRRQIGGASTIWGGRCVPYDRVDFDDRPGLSEARWPVSYDELTTYFQRACDWLACGRRVFDAGDTEHLPPSLVPGLPNEEALTSTLERWSLPTDFGRHYRAELRQSRRLHLVTGVTCTRIDAGVEGTVDRLVCRTLTGREVHVSARRYVIACGGLESTRLLLASRSADGRAIGDHSDHLGRWYMGHLEGVVANVRFATPPRETIFDFERDLDGVYVRRRLSFSREFQHAEALPNIAAWLVHPEPADPSHRSGVLSLAYLALASPLGSRLAPEALRAAMTGDRVPGVPYGGVDTASPVEHLKNVARDLGPTLRFVMDFGRKRFLTRRRRVPGFAVYSRDNVYALQYHSEHLPDRRSRVTLADEPDALGMPRLRIDVRFGEADVAGVVQAHRHWDDYLRRHRVGRIEYLADDVAEAVRSRCGAGFHQSGTTRMAARSEDGVVTPDLAVHGLPELHVLSSSVFPTSSQANSTFMVVVFAVRLADHLKRMLGEPRDIATEAQPTAT